MGKILKGILGGFSGLVGTVIGSSWRGLDVIKSRPKKSSKPPVQSMVDQRFKFKLMITFLKRAKAFIDLGFNSKGKVNTSMNEALNYNLPNAITGTSPAFKIDFTKLLLSNGDLPAINSAAVTAAAGKTLNFTWDAYEDPDQLEESTLLRNTDKIAYFMYNPVTDITLRGRLSGTRGDKTGKAVVSTTMVGTACHLWVIPQSTDGKSIARSQYLGLVTALV